MLDAASEYSASVYDSLPERIAIIDTLGVIQSVNQSWIDFGVVNECTCTELLHWQGVNYLEVCDRAATAGGSAAEKALTGINQVIAQKDTDFVQQYACRAPNGESWYSMRVRALRDVPTHYVVSHSDITPIKTAELEYQALAMLDQLTGLANKNRFYQQLIEEWSRSSRSDTPLALIFIDIDFFKGINDLKGHLYGDEILVSVASVIGQFARRPGDLAARFGGDEFVLMLKNSSLDMATVAASKILDSIRALDLTYSENNSITVSLGVASMVPKKGISHLLLVDESDRALLAAKRNGRNQISLYSTLP